MSQINENRKRNIVNKATFAKLLDEPQIVNLIHKQYTSQIKTIIKNTSKFQKSKSYCYCYDTSTAMLLKLILKFFRAIVSLYAVIIYVISTYYDNDSSESTMNQFIFISEFTIATLISLDISISFINSKKKIKFLKNILVILDIVIVLAIYLAYIFDNTRNLGFARIFRLIRIVRVLRLFKLFRNPREKEENNNDTSFNVFLALTNILSVLFIFSGIIHFLANTFPLFVAMSNTSQDSFGCLNGSNITNSSMDVFREGYSVSQKCPEGEPYVKIPAQFTFDTAFYYTVVTMISLGYGDIFPSGSYSRAILSSLIFIFVIIFTTKINQLQDLIKINDSFKQSFSGENHIIISGSISKHFLLKFLSEFNVDFILQNKKVLIISQDYPSKEIQFILTQYAEIIFYYVGELFNERTVEDCKIEHSSFVFLISDPFIWNSKTYENEVLMKEHDQMLILASKFFSQYTLNAKICCQFYTSNSLLHSWAGWDISFSSQQIQMAMICKNGFVDGFITMLSNLITRGNNFFCPEVLDVQWIAEYVNGASNKIFIMKMSKAFFHSESNENFLAPKEENQLQEKTINYSELVKKFCLSYDILLIGVKTKIKSKIVSGGMYEKIYLNPFGYNIKEEDELILIACDNEKLEQILNNSYVPVPSTTTTAANNNANPPTDPKKFILELKKEKINSEEEEPERVVFSEKRHFRIWDDHEHLKDCLQNHFLLYSPEEKIEEFMSVFQYLYDDWIYYVSDAHPTAIWEKIKDYFPKLIYIESSFSDIQDFYKLNVGGCRHVFIFSWKVKFSSADSGILPIVKIMEENFPKTKCTIELEDEENLKYLNNFLVKEETNKSMFYNLYKISSAVKKITDFQNIPIRIWPKYAKSDIFFSSFISVLPAIFYHSPDILEIMTKILQLQETNYVPDSPELKETYDNDYEIGAYVYNDGEKLKYEDVCKMFLSQEEIILPIAVYRTHNNTALQNPESYIVTNPKKDLILQKGDKVICFHSNSLSSSAAFGTKIEDQELTGKKYTKMISNIIPGFTIRELNENLEENEILDIIGKEFEEIKRLKELDMNDLLHWNPTPKKNKFRGSTLFKSDIQKYNSKIKIEENVENEIDLDLEKNEIFVNNVENNEKIVNPNPNDNNNLDNNLSQTGVLKKKQKAILKNKKLTFAETLASTSNKKRPINKKMGKTLVIKDDDATKKRLSVLFDFNLNNAYKQEDNKSFENDKPLDESQLTENRIISG